LSAELQLKQLGGAGRVDAPETFTLPHAWEPPRDLDCGDYRLTGSLKQSDGLHSPESYVDLLGSKAGLALPPQPLVAICGQGAQTRLTATFPPDTCQSPKLTWTQQSGPPLVQPLLEGNSQPLATQDTGFDSLVGQSVVLDVTADSGSGTPASKTYTLPITVVPFVKVSHRTELPAATDTDFIGIFTQLQNTTSCGVTQVHYEEQLEGFTYVKDSARFNGQKVDVTWDGTTLSADHLELAGDATGTFTYLARPHLVGSRHLQGAAWLNAVPISQPDALEPPSDSGCGCTSPAGSAPLLLALGTLMAAVRRRRP
jgi:MYXO-CTERM domain-containing protein